MKKKQNIKCEVTSCKYNVNSKDCNLEEIKVSSNCDCSNNNVTHQDETICASFEFEKEKD